ncbi:hypothetical protein HDU99_005675, partial [Rhizoclosmatium hyalinum]
RYDRDYVKHYKRNHGNHNFNNRNHRNNIIYYNGNLVNNHKCYNCDDFNINH